MTNTRTSLSRNSSAEICRQNDWKPGTLIEAEYTRDEPGQPRTRHRQRRLITAVGERLILTRLIALDALNLEGVTEEEIIDLHVRDWHAVE